MNRSQINNLIRSFQQELDKAASPKTKAWWEGYMKYVIPFRGVGIPKIRKLLEEWRIQNNLDRIGIEKELVIALDFFKGAFTEDKLAGILYLQEFLFRKFDWKELLPHYEQLFHNKLIFDWNVCDWFCVRVLGPGIPIHEMPYAKAVTTWKNAPYLWQARSALVPFTKVASDKKYYPLIKGIGITLIQREERFAKTAVGWILRDISKHDPKYVTDFMENQLEYFTIEVLRNATKYFKRKEKRQWIQHLKAIDNH